MCKRIIIFILLSAVQILSQSIKDIYDSSKSSIVLIVSYDNNQTPLGMGSGFYFGENLIATNYHVIKNASSFLIKNIGEQSKFSDVNVKSYSENFDIAILEVKEKAKPLNLISEQAQIGEVVIAIGNPKGLEGTISTGIISGVRDIEDFNIYQITAPISPGSSGGPILNEKGEVIGLATFTIKESQNLNFAVPAELLLLLEGKTMSWEPLSSKSELYKKSDEGLELVYFKKDGSEFYEYLSLKNMTQYTITNIIAIVIYKNMRREMLDFQLIESSQIIPSGYTKMITINSFDKGQNFKYYKSDGYNYEKFDVEMRILSYDILDTPNKDIFDELMK